MSTIPQQETEVVVGPVIGVRPTQKPDTWKIVVQPDGSQYEKNLWTKDAALVAAMGQRLNQRLAFDCGVSHWNNNQGQPVRSLWVNGVSDAPAEAQVMQPIGQTVIGQLPGLPVQQPQPLAPVVPLQQPQAPMQQPQPVQPQAQQQSFVPQDVKEERIMRQTAAKCAVWMLPTLPADKQTFPDLIRVAEGWVTYFVHGPAGIQMAQPVAFDGEAHDAQAQAVHQQVLGQQPAGQFQPDDIPF